MKKLGPVILTCIAAAPAYALVSLEFLPLNPVVNVGDIIEVELYATTNLAVEEFVAVDTILVWTDSIMNPVGSHQGSGAYSGWTASGFMANEMNASLSDGNAFWTGLGPLIGTLPAATPAGTLLTTFTFTANQIGVATLEMPAIYNWPGRPQPFESRVYGAQFTDLTGNLAAPVTIQVVPEPATIAALGVGVAALIRRRRKA